MERHSSPHREGEAHAAAHVRPVAPAVPLLAADPVLKDIPAAVADLDIGVIYTYEDEWMTPLVASLARSGDDLRMRLLLVDNLSEGGVDRWTTTFPRTTVLRNERRLGYAANLNCILQASTAPFVLLLNTDMRFDPEEQCLSKLVRFLREHPDCGVCGCRLYHEDGSYAWPARRHLSLRRILARRLRWGARWQRDEDELLYRERSPHESFACDWLSGCLLAVRRAAYEEIGGLDEGFRKYFEDVDFCLRMQRAGWTVRFHGGTYGHHLEQRSSTRLVSRDALRHLASYARWLGKWGFDPWRDLRSSPETSAAPTPDDAAIAARATPDRSSGTTRPRTMPVAPILTAERDQPDRRAA